ncbi:hypothetical protein Pan14r_54760 [Crateriforma conspicua]|uniref:Uncharacterized protein n=1 Tax=Crateriforma conspicua TaxID=2527996 RepID=A0A5C5XRE6_9PLAN|nr:hypothetical protein Pan14r_54760 [Crateriforma conspicua]
MRCNGAGLARFHEWIINCPGPLIADVLPPRNFCDGKLNTMDDDNQRIIADADSQLIGKLDQILTLLGLMVNQDRTRCHVWQRRRTHWPCSVDARIAMLTERRDDHHVPTH